MLRKVTCLCLLIVLVLSACNRQDKIVYSERDDNKRVMDMIVWYDIDHGSKAKNGIGWWPLNPQHPGRIKASGYYRTTTPLLGLYDIGEESTVVQHLYWFAALGANAVTCDWTNYTTEPGPNIKYNKDIYNNTENFLRTAQKIQGNVDFPVAKLYPTVRLYEERYELLSSVLDNAYALYEKYSDVWYKFDGSDKPFIVIFADWSLLNDEWHDKEIPFKDDRFDIRWSNGHLYGSTVEDNQGRLKIPKDKPYWLFVEEVKDEKEGYYKVFYKEGKDNKVEQMMCWAAIYNGWSQEEDSPWDGMDQVYDGKTTFERSLRDVKELSPKALLVNRFNYPMAWTQHPYEGISLYDSVHFEQNRDFGFLVFNNVMKNLYDLNNWVGKSPLKPEPEMLEGNRFSLPIINYPLEYRIGIDEDFTDSEWKYININEWISYEEYLDNDGIYVQTRNAFGESDIAYVKLK